MNNKFLLWTSRGYLALCIFSLGMVALMAFQSPQAVMDLVQTPLPNTDAMSSIRGIYGGVGLSIVIALIYLWRTNLRLALGYLSLFWSLYAISRIITGAVDGPLGAFGTQWLYTESFFALFGFILWWRTGKSS